MTDHSHNLLALAFKTNLEQNPEVFTVPADIGKQCAEAAKKTRELNPVTPEPLKVEYNRLRSRLFDLQQNAKSLEIRVNELAGRVHLLDKRIAEALRLKKQESDKDNLLGARTYEHQVQSLEDELADAKAELQKAMQYNKGAVRQLREFRESPDFDRIAQLKQELGE